MKNIMALGELVPPDQQMVRAPMEANPSHILFQLSNWLDETRVTQRN
jgi:hypothetical protein